MRDPWAGAILDRVRPDLTIPDRILKFFELSNEFCLSMSLELTSLAGSAFGSLVEPFIDQDYCQLNGPCGPDDFFDVVNGPGLYTAFLSTHNPAIDPAVVTATGLGRRPDIVSHRVGSQAEWYEIKPLSQSGLREGLSKGIELRATYAASGFPYLPGRLYKPSKEISLGRFTADGGEQLEVFLEVVRPVDALILYRLCLRGDYVQYFNRVRLIAGILAILAAIAAEAAAAAATAEAAASALATIQAIAAELSAALPSLVPAL